MNRIRISLLSLAFTLIQMPYAFSQSDDFEEVYRQATDRVYSYLYKDKYGPVTPLWKDQSTFCYQTDGKDSTEYYKIDLKSLTKTQVTKDSLDAYRTPERQRGPWGGFAGGPTGNFAMFPGRSETGTRSPDGQWECIVRDHNIWVRNIETRELTQLSFDGNEQDQYAQPTWSPDSRYISTLRKQEHKERQILLRNSRPDDQVQPTYRWIDYDKPGDPLPQAVPALFDITALKQIPIDVTPSFMIKYFIFSRKLYHGA